MIIGGGMTFTFVKALGGKIGFYLWRRWQTELALKF
jgi:3-phosphoglycerate kinase